MQIEIPIMDCPIILKPGAIFHNCEESKMKWANSKWNLHHLRGRVIAYGYDIEANVKNLITFLFKIDDASLSKLTRNDLGSIILKELNFSQKIRVLDESLKKLDNTNNQLVKDLDFIRKRRNKFAHELISLIPINEGVDGFTAVFEKDGSETIINQKFVDEFFARCQKVISEISLIQKKYTED